MIRRVIGTTAAVLLTAGIGATSASAAPVNRPLADQLTSQFNQQELGQLQASDTVVYSLPGAGPVAVRPLGQLQPALQPAPMPPPDIPPRPVWSPLPY